MKFECHKKFQKKIPSTCIFNDYNYWYRHPITVNKINKNRENNMFQTNCNRNEQLLYLFTLFSRWKNISNLLYFLQKERKNTELCWKHLNTKYCTVFCEENSVGGREDNSIHFTPFGIFYPGLLLPETYPSLTLLHRINNN